MRDVESFSLRLYWKRCWAHRGLRTGEARIYPAVCDTPSSLPRDRQIMPGVRCKLIGRAELSVRWGPPSHIYKLERGRGYYIACFLPSLSSLCIFILPLSLYLSLVNLISICSFLRSAREAMTLIKIRYLNIQMLTTRSVLLKWFCSDFTLNNNWFSITKGITEIY